MKFHVVTLFPEVIEAYTGASILGRAQREKKLNVKAYQLRDTVANKWGKADERPYGGGPGMVLQAEPFIKAVDKIKKGKKGVKVLITSAGGKEFTNEYAKKLAKQKEVIILCGRYEGIDARVKKALGAEEVSVGNYILTGGELPALTIIDATARQIKGVLGTFDSLEEGRVASHDVFTRPEVFEYKKKKYSVPKVLLSGHHANIDTLRAKRRSGKSL
ncbi:MAG TPA: tRNA (guanosine(37)-N1)-methyltransferase TrmD [Candidatus Paceibacterota bacterium]|nr:tRNA (guanosine(37)-N1)-methyltransferase TrmD [Candidatus Paceibacterota bacterium]